LITLIGTALLAILIWFFGPFLAAFEGWGIRLAIIAVILLLWAGINFALDIWRSRREAALIAGATEAALIAGATQAAPDPAAVASAEEAAALEDRLTTALALLKRARGTAGYLYEQPWYVIIGPPGAGKTTALLNAGLRFPLAAEMGQGAVAGVGGTRLCDWWFTEDGVLIDTAGRYTTQDSDATVDRAGWGAFLDLLKRTRIAQPLNGVIVAISLTDIGAATREDRLAHAHAVRRRLKELEVRLAVRLPVYAVFTKADLLTGFTEFFDDLDREKRAQVWGATFPLTDAPAGNVGGFAPEFQALIERLDTRLFDRLQAERSPDRRALIAGFPAQVASLETPLTEFLQEAFGGSRLDPAPMLRGFYLTSGTQEGTPFDRLTGVLARTFGIDQRRAATLRPVEGRSYFLARLVKEVIFGEAMLVSEKPGSALRRLMLRAGAYALAAVVVLAAGGLAWRADSANRHDMDELDSALAAYTKTTAGLPLDRVADGALPPIVPLLNQARELPYGYERGADERFAWAEFGLSQLAKMAAGARAVYRHALERVLLPRLIWRLEAQMHGAVDRPEYLYEATRVYLMLGAAGPLDPDLVKTWMTYDWEQTYPGLAMAHQREDLARHLDALLADPLPAIPLDGALLAAARATFSRVPPAARVYSRIASAGAAQSVPPWRPADPLGAAGARVFLRASGKPLTDGIPGFFTVDGFHKVLLPALSDVTKQVASESWVLGSRSEIAPGSADAERIERDVIGLYEADYAKQWDAMLGDLALVPLRTAEQASQDLFILGAPQSPMRDLLGSIARQLTLTQAPPAPRAETEKKLAEAAAQQAAPSATARLKPLIGTQSAAPPPEPPGKRIDDHYRPLRDFVGSGSGAPIDQALKAIDALHQQLARIGGSSPAAAPGGEDAVQLLREEAGRDPQPVARWLEALAASGNALINGRARQQMTDAFNASGGPAERCQKAVTGHYPFVTGTANDTPPDDFAKLFSPGGLIDGFFNTQLRPYVDTSGTNWKTRPVDGVTAPIAQNDLAQFQRAAVIRDVFFGAGGNAPSFRFEMTPVSLDGAAKQVTLVLGAATITYDSGSPSSTQITWPGSNGMSVVRLAFDVPSSSGSAASTSASSSSTLAPAGAGLHFSGAWALFRLFDGRLQQSGSSDKYMLTLQSSGHEATFEIRAGSVQNPFVPGLLRNFQCPKL
jgi:type VI secretion system protein ImpL